MKQLIAILSCLPILPIFALPPAVRISNGGILPIATAEACSTITTTIGTIVDFIPVPCPATGLPSIFTEEVLLSGKTTGLIVGPSGNVNFAKDPVIRQQPDVTSQSGSYVSGMVSSSVAAQIRSSYISISSIGIAVVQAEPSASQSNGNAATGAQNTHGVATSGAPGYDTASTGSSKTQVFPLPGTSDKTATGTATTSNTGVLHSGINPSSFGGNAGPSTNILTSRAGGGGSGGGVVPSVTPPPEHTSGLIPVSSYPGAFAVTAPNIIRITQDGTTETFSRSTLTDLAGFTGTTTITTSFRTTNTHNGIAGWATGAVIVGAGGVFFGGLIGGSFVPPVGPVGGTCVWPFCVPGPDEVGGGNPDDNPDDDGDDDDDHHSQSELNESQKSQASQQGSQTKASQAASQTSIQTTGPTPMTSTHASRAASQTSIRTTGLATMSSTIASISGTCLIPPEVTLPPKSLTDPPPDPEPDSIVVVGWPDLGTMASHVTTAALATTGGLSSSFTPLVSIIPPVSSVPPPPPAQPAVTQISSNNDGSGLCVSLSDHDYNPCKAAASQYNINATVTYHEYNSRVAPNGFTAAEVFVPFSDWGCAAMWTCDNAAAYAVGMTGAAIEAA
ncbi:hypothetical protein MMC21_007416 [Puttea exsequens]|nr:hypothetical protein [Puttea exsequens]